MGKNLSSSNSPEYVFIKRLIDLEAAFKDLRTNQLSILNVPHYTTDPSSPVDNQIWINDTTHTLKIRVNGVTKTVTLT